MPRLKRESKYLGSTQAADYLGLAKSTLTYWRRKGVLRPTRTEQTTLGVRYLYEKSDLDAFRERIDYD